MLPFTFEAHMDVVALGGIETGRVVESQSDGVATYQVQLTIYHEAMKLNDTWDRPLCRLDHTFCLTPSL